MGRVQAQDKEDAKLAKAQEMEERRVVVSERGAANEEARTGIERDSAAENRRAHGAAESLGERTLTQSATQHTEDLKAQMDRLRQQLAGEANIAAGSRDDRLLGAIIEDESGKYTSQLRDNTQQRQAIIANPLLLPAQRDAALKALPAEMKPPSMQDLMQRFKVLRGVVNNKGSLPDDGTISDKELVDSLMALDPQAQARGKSLLPYVSPAQQTRVNNLIQKKMNVQRKPAVNVTP